MILAGRVALLVGAALVGAVTEWRLRPLDPPAVVEIAYSPAANLERADVELIGEARHTLDVAAYSLTSHAVVDALAEAAGRGVKVRILVERTQAARDYLAPLAGRAEIREWGPTPLMHLKTLAVDGSILREGSANFSPSGLKSQLNSRLVLIGGEPVATFAAVFEREWARSRPYP